MSFIPRPHEIYKHFKGNLYQITAIAEHTETGETLVVYQALYGDYKTYARPLDMFISPVDREKYPDAAQEFRFELQGVERVRQELPSEPAGKPEPGQEAPSEPAGKPEPGQEAPSEPAGKPEPGQEAPSEPAGKPEPGQEVPSEPIREHAVSEEVSGELTEELDIDPMVLEFLDADSYEQRLNILTGLHHRITDDMISTMAIACDVEIGEGDIEERYESLKACLVTMERFECNRLR